MQPDFLPQANSLPITMPATFQMTTFFARNGKDFLRRPGIVWRSAS
jgi:hypothetical protein